LLVSHGVRLRPADGRLSARCRLDRLPEIIATSMPRLALMASHFWPLDRMDSNAEERPVNTLASRNTPTAATTLTAKRVCYIGPMASPLGVALVRRLNLPLSKRRVMQPVSTSFD